MTFAFIAGALVVAGLVVPVTWVRAWLAAIGALLTAYVLPFGLLAGLNASFATGAPLSILGSGQSWSGYQMYLEPRGSWDQLPSTYNVDVHLEYPLRFGSVTVTPLLDVFNLTNVQTATDRGQIYNDQPDGNQSPPYTNPTVADFGKDTRWQSPRIVRLGARVSF